jgi:hypothetical protein
MKKAAFILIVVIFTTLCMSGFTANAAQCNPEIIMTAEKTIQKGSQFELTIKLDGPGNDIYAQDITIHYNAEMFSFNTIDSLDTGTMILNCNNEKAGEIRVISANMNGLESSSPLYKLTFSALNSKPGTKGQFEITGVKLGTAPKGTVIQAKGSSITVLSACDKTILIKKLDNAKKLLLKISEATKKSQYGSIPNLQKIIDSVSAVLYNVNADQDTVNAATGQLDKAFEAIGTL